MAALVAWTGDATYRVEVARMAEKDLRHMVQHDRKRVLAVIYSLADNLRPPGCAKLTGREGYRVRVGDFRVT